MDPAVLADRVYRFEAPIWVVYDALVIGQDNWLVLQPGEVAPQVLEAVRTSSVVWSSFWPLSPLDKIEFDLTEPGKRGGAERPSEGTSLRFRWSTSSPPDDRGIAITRQRLNRKFGSHLRAWVDSAWSPVSWDPPASCA
jgi:hypothetical protein